MAKCRIHLIFSLIIFVSISLFAQVPADQAINLLVAGNNRFVTGELMQKDYATEVQKLKDGQKPYAVILSCSDSRVAPEIVFDESLGKLFIVRLAGNVATPEAIGSIEYAVEHLGANLILVLGHAKCGAVSATVSGGEATPNIEKLISYIEPAVASARNEDGEADLLSRAIHFNVDLQVKNLTKNSQTLEHKHHSGSLQIIGAFYDLATGQVIMH